MGAELKLTKARLDLLRAVAAGLVFDLPDHEADSITTFDTTGAEDGHPGRRVTARIDEFVHAGWVCISRNDMTWELTDAGRKAVAGEPPDLMRALRDSLDAAKMAKVDTDGQ